jgi:hypothetical protein
LQTDGLELVGVEGHPTAGAAERKARADDGGETDVSDGRLGFLQRPGIATARQRNSHLLHRRLEELPVFGLVDGVQRGTDEADAILFENPLLRQRLG